MLKIAGKHILVIRLEFWARFESGVLKITGKFIEARFEAGGAENCKKIHPCALV